MCGRPGCGCDCGSVVRPDDQHTRRKREALGRLGMVRRGVRKIKGRQDVGKDLNSGASSYIDSDPVHATHATRWLRTGVGPVETSSHQQGMTSAQPCLKWGDRRALCTPGPQDHRHRAEEASTARDTVKGKTNSMLFWKTLKSLYKTARGK
jgi:hypothetical protein